MLRLYILSVIFTTLSMLGAVYALDKEIKKLFTEDELYTIKRKGKSSINPFTIFAIIFCPILNIVYCLVYTFSYDDVRDRTLQRYYSILQDEKIAKKLRDKLRGYVE